MACLFFLQLGLNHLSAINIMLLWWAAVALTSISNCCIWFGALSYLCYLCTHSKPTAGLSKHTEQTRQGCCQDPRVELVYASKAQRAGQRAGPFLSKCGDECMWMEMNGTRNINNSYLPLRWPFLVLRSSFTSLCLLPRWAWLSQWPLYALFSQYITQGTDTSHTKHRLYLCPHFIFLRVKTCWHSSSLAFAWQDCDSCAPVISKPATHYWPSAHKVHFLMTFHVF